MSRFKPKSAFDKIFEVGILLKGLDGLIETVGGTLLLFVSPGNINHLVKTLTGQELNTDPHDFIALHLVHWANQLTKGAIIFGGIYLVAHGVSKLILVIEILRNRLWAYIGLIILTGGFIVYQLYEVIANHSISLTLLTIFDIIIVFLTVHEYKKQKSIHASADKKE